MLNKTLLALCLLLQLAAFAQTDPRADELRSKIWGDATQAFSQTEIPERWTDEPAVILAISNELGYKKLALSSKLIEYNYFHERTKILSQQALEHYAQFSYPENFSSMTFERSYYVGFKIVKPDGREIIVPLESAVREEIETKGKTSFGMMKLAIPNLEIGDIIDYYLANEKKFTTSKFHDFDPAIFQLRRKYATVYGRVSFAVLRRCFINLRTYNGAPNFVRTTDPNGEEDIYTLEYSDQEKTEDYPWFYPYRSLPTVKFKVTYASPMVAYQYPSLIDASRPGELNSEVSPEQLKSLLNRYFAMMYDYTGLIKHMKKKHKGQTDKIVLAKEAFLYERNKLAVESAEMKTISEGETPSMSYFLAINNLGTYFKKAKIPYDLILAVPKNIGEIDDIILEEELVMAMKTRTHPPVYFANFSIHALPDEISELFQGSKVYISNKDVSSIDWSFTPYTIPTSKPEENTERSQADIVLNLKDITTTLTIEKTHTGLAKTDEQLRVLDVYDYLTSEEEKYEMESLTYGMMATTLKKTEAQRADYLKDREVNRHKRMKEYAESRWDFKLDTLHSFLLMKSGRTLEEPEFKFSFKAASSDLLSKVGENYLFDIGLLIEQQVHVAKEFKENREFDIYMNYPRVFENTIWLYIPEGYEVQGFEKLNTNVQNETGGFTSEVRLAKDKLIVEVKKHYANGQEPASNWSKMLEFIDEADNFNELKILLRKVNP